MTKETLLVTVKVELQYNRPDVREMLLKQLSLHQATSTYGRDGEVGSLRTLDDVFGKTDLTWKSVEVKEEP